MSTIITAVINQIKKKRNYDNPKTYQPASSLNCKNTMGEKKEEERNKKKAKEKRLYKCI